MPMPMPMPMQWEVERSKCSLPFHRKNHEEETEMHRSFRALEIDWARRRLVRRCCWGWWMSWGIGVEGSEVGWVSTPNSWSLLSQFSEEKSTLVVLRCAIYLWSNDTELPLSIGCIGLSPPVITSSLYRLFFIEGPHKNDTFNCSSVLLIKSIVKSLVCPNFQMPPTCSHRDHQAFYIDKRGGGISVISMSDDGSIWTERWTDGRWFTKSKVHDTNFICPWFVIIFLIFVRW